MQRQFSVFQQFSKIFSRKFVKISGLKCQKFSIFIFKKVFSIAFQILFRFFSLLNNKFFQFEDFQLQIFQAFIFFNFVFTKIFFRLNFVKFKCEFSSDFWRIKIQNFQPNFFGDCTQRKSIGEVRGIRRTLVQEFTNEADAFSDWLN